MQVSTRAMINASTVYIAINAPDGRRFSFVFLQYALNSFRLRLKISCYAGTVGFNEYTVYNQILYTVYIIYSKHMSMVRMPTMYQV